MDTDEKAVWWAYVLVFLLIIFLIGLFSWGFIEIIQWITSK